MKKRQLKKLLKKPATYPDWIGPFVAKKSSESLKKMSDYLAMRMVSNESDEAKAYRGMSKIIDEEEVYGSKRD